MSMPGGKGGSNAAPAAPNYQPLYAADTAAANAQTALSSQQLQFGQQQFNQIEPYVGAYLNAQTGAMEGQAQFGQSLSNQYQGTYQPLMTEFANQAQNYNSPQMASQQAGAAEGDVASSFDAQRAAATSSLESYGIDPSQTRYQALDLGTRISQAAATAAAGTQSRLNTANTGLALEGAAINQGQNLPGMAATTFGSGAAIGSGALGQANAATTTANQSTALGSNILGAGVTGYGAAGNLTNTGYQNQLSTSNANAAMAANQSSGIGSLIGGALGGSGSGMGGLGSGLSSLGGMFGGSGSGGGIFSGLSSLFGGSGAAGAGAAGVESGVWDVLPAVAAVAA